MKDIINQFLQAGLKAFVLTLQPIHWVDKQGEQRITYAWSNRRQSGRVTINGESKDDYSVSIFKPGQTQVGKPDMIITVWANSMDEEEYQMYLDKVGKDFIGTADEDGNVNVFSKDDALGFLGSPSTDVEEHASVNA